MRYIRRMTTKDTILSIRLTAENLATLEKALDKHRAIVTEIMKRAGLPADPPYDITLSQWARCTILARADKLLED